MGILNVTPDSFSDGGQFLSQDAALTRGIALRDAGAHLIDIGGESTRPGSLAVAADEQVRRVVPVIRALTAQIDTPISIDTTSAKVAQAALDAGAVIVNDISGCTFDAEMVKLVASREVPVVVMHTSALPEVMQQHTDYVDVCSEVTTFLMTRRDALVRAGVSREQIVLDPGIGFGKTRDQNLQLLKGLPHLVAQGQPVLVGTSRKRFLGELTGHPVERRDPATAASVAVAIAYGAHIVRVHDVRAVHDAVVVADAIVRGAAATI